MNINKLSEELLKCNNFNYKIKIGNYLYLSIHTKKPFQSLFDNSYYMEGAVGISHRFSYNKHYHNFQLSKFFDNLYEKNNHTEIESIIEKNLYMKNIRLMKTIN